MGSLHYGNVSIVRDGSTVSCLVDGSVVGTLVLELAEGARGLSLPFSSDHTFWLAADEANALFDVEAPVVEEPVAEEVAAPAPTSRRGRRRV